MIDLLDGDQLAGKLKELRLCIKTDMVESVEADGDWFRNIWEGLCTQSVQIDESEWLRGRYWIIEGLSPIPHDYIPMPKKLNTIHHINKLDHILMLSLLELQISRRRHGDEQANAGRRCVGRLPERNVWRDHPGGTLAACFGVGLCAGLMMALRRRSR